MASKQALSFLIIHLGRFRILGEFDHIGNAQFIENAALMGGDSGRSQVHHFSDSRDTQTFHQMMHHLKFFGA